MKSSLSLNVCGTKMFQTFQILVLNSLHTTLFGAIKIQSSLSVNVCGRIIYQTF